MDLNHVTIIVTKLERSVSFYEALGLEMIVYSPPRYARFAMPEGRASFSIEVVEGALAVQAQQALIYFECRNLDAVCERVSAVGIRIIQRPTDMPYLWREARLNDPDGHEIRLYSAGQNRLRPPWRLQRTAGSNGSVSIVRWRGDRKELYHLFQIADDSEMQIAANLNVGELIVAGQSGHAIGMAQITGTQDASRLELKNIATLTAFRAKGIGHKLLLSAIDYSRGQGARSLRVSTSIASCDAIAFYLKHGFRISGFVRDAFTPDRGYAADALTNGLPLNDAVELELDLRAEATD